MNGTSDRELSWSFRPLSNKTTWPINWGASGEGSPLMFFGTEHFHSEIPHYFSAPTHTNILGRDEY